MRLLWRKGDPFAGSPAPQAFFFGSSRCLGDIIRMDHGMDAAGAPSDCAKMYIFLLGNVAFRLPS